MIPLTDAIRLGSMIRPQVSGYFFLNGASCAQGAALEATGMTYLEEKGISDKAHAQFVAQWPWVTVTTARCPVCWIEGSVHSLIPHLNNTFDHPCLPLRNIYRGHGWTREQIADWLETIDPDKARVEAPATAEPVAV